MKTKEFGERVRRLREQKGLSKGEVAKKLGAHRNYLNGIETGERGMTLRKAVGLARIFGVQLDWLATGEGSQMPPTETALTEDELELVQLFRMLPKWRPQILGMARTAADASAINRDESFPDEIMGPETEVIE